MERKILVVEDDLDILRLVTFSLEKSGYEVLTAVNGKEGLEKATNDRPDIILLDLMMPFMGGAEMLERLKEIPDMKDVPVIILTARCDQQNIAAIRAYGVSDYVTKPFGPTELMEKIENTLGCKTCK